MATFTIKESVFKEFISVEKIREVVKRVAAQINKDYEGKSTTISMQPYCSLECLPAQPPS